MPGIRIAAAGASFLLFLTVALGSALAQSATAGAAGQPLPLLQFVHAKSKAKLRLHPKMAAKWAKTKKTVRRTVAKRTVAKRHEAIVDARPVQVPTPPATPGNIWPVPDTVAPNGTAEVAPDQAPTPVTTEPVVETDPNQIVAGGHSVQTALPNGINEADVADNAAKKGEKTAATPKPMVHAMVVKADAADSAMPTNPIDSASWIAHVLAALGGALTAGAVAWFLIRPAPGRTYG